MNAQAIPALLASIRNLLDEVDLEDAHDFVGAILEYRDATGRAPELVAAIRSYVTTGSIT